MLKSIYTDEIVFSPGSTIIENEKLIVFFLLDSKIDFVAYEYRIGVVNFCNYKSKQAFIDPSCDKDAVDEVIDNGLSVVFKRSSVKASPKSVLLDTKTNIYLVIYATTGTVTNKKQK